MADPREAADTPTQGLFIAGEFLSLQPDRAYEWPEGSGKMREPWVAKVLVGDSVFNIEYASHSDAVAAGLEVFTRGDQVTVPVFARGPYVDGRPGRVRFSGRAPRRGG